jgi:diguanylate cyclase (GGDEF)-like protein/PAS domain S-box-containing protein
MLVVGQLLINARAGEREGLRQAQVALAAAPYALSNVVAVPEALLAGETFPSSAPSAVETRLIQLQLGGPATQGIEFAALEINRRWHTAIARNLKADVTLLNARAEQMTRLLADHHARQASMLNEAYVQPLAKRLGSEIVQANAQLDRQITSGDRATRLATLGVTGVAATLLVVLLVAIGVARRRRLHAEGQQLRNEIEQRTLRESEERMTALVQHGSDLVIVVEPDSSVLYAAGPAEAMLGYTPRELLGRKLDTLVDGADAAVLRELCRTQANRRELRIIHRSGELVTCEAHATSLLHDPRWRGVVLNIWDISQRKALEDRLRHQAFHDALTGLPNRVLAIDRAEQLIARGQRAAVPCAALYLDLDGFKEINDTLGHAAGDSLLAEVASRLSDLVRPGDTAARLGGDEFLVLLAGAEHDFAPELVAERLLHAIGEAYAIEGADHDVTVTASIGIAGGRHHSADELLRDADLALYEAKASGRNRYVYFDAGDTPHAEQRALTPAHRHNPAAAKRA